MSLKLPKGRWHIHEEGVKDEEEEEKDEAELKLYLLQ